LKGKLVSSFRVEIVLYSLLSLMLTLLSESIIFSIIYFIIKLIDPLYIEHLNGTFTSESINNSNLGYRSNTTFGSRLDEYRIRENINISIHLNREIFIALIILAISLGIGFFIFYFLLLTRKFTNQLYNISNGINEISTGNFKHRIPIESVNELGLISLGLNKMAYKLEQIIAENEKNEKNKNAIVTSLAHDLRTPLTSITGYLDLLANNTNLADETRDHYLKVVYNKSKNLENLIEDLFDYTRVSLGEISVHNITINMAQFVNQLVDEFYPSFRENELEYSVKIDASHILVEGDGELLARAISNLISNAIKYGKDGKMVNVYLKKEKNQAVLQIVNYGQLIPEEALPHLFERFYRVEGSRSYETGGTGLGLSIAKEIIELHGGSISARSDFDGTVFEVRLEAKDGDGNE
jgi:two-component system sensor histidine kinase VanS